MSRLKHAEPILQAAAEWKHRCLFDGRSVFSDDRLWTIDNFRDLNYHYVERLDEGEGQFDVKLKRQLDPASPEAKRLWAEVAWVYSLYPSGTSAQTKRGQVSTYWGWSGEELQENHRALTDAVLAGVGGGGTAYNTLKWREFLFIITMMVDWFMMPYTERESMSADPWRFSRWLDHRQHVAGRMFRHVLLYFLFPEYFEPIASFNHKLTIARELSEGTSINSINYRDHVAVDQAVRKVRQRLEQQFPEQEVNFYRPPVSDLWQPSVTTIATTETEKVRVSDEEAATWFRDRFAGSKRVWWLSAGADGHLWTEFTERDAAMLSYGDLGDLSGYANRDEMTDDLVKLGRGPRPWNRSLALVQFSKEMQINDVVIAQYGGLHVLGWGYVTGDYTYDLERPEYPHRRSVKWHACDPPVTVPDRTIAKALTDFSPYKPFVYQIFERIDKRVDERKLPAAFPFTIETAMEGLFVSREQFHRILESIRLRRNLILQGPPGTGKTFIAQRIAWCLIGRKDPSQTAMVQFHQSYAYEDFVQGWRPTNQGGFSLKNGVFFKFCEHAREHPNERYVFIIDEINRGNLSRIFGELLMLIESDKRSSEYAVSLTYDGDGKPFYIPPNVYILGMMNTADRSLALVDYALRRRFAFEELAPAFGTDEFRDYLHEIGLDLPLINVIVERMEALNEEIRDDSELGRGFQIGHSFFVPGDDGELSDDWFEHVVRTQIRPLLQEYWFDTPKRVERAVNGLLAS